MRGRSAAFEVLGADPPARRTVRIVEVDAPMLVLGSTRPVTDVDAARARDAGVLVARRRSGGGAVLLRPHEAVWIDVAVPAGDRLWDDDVNRAFLWLGAAWVDALATVGVASRRHEGGPGCTAWARRVCFGGIGAGEVTLDDGRKVVGLAQRRTRAGALFQCAALLRWDPRALVDLLALAPDERATALADLEGAAAGLDVGGDGLVDALLDRLRDD